MEKKRSCTPAVLAIIVAGGLLPVILYWFVLGTVPTVTAESAKDALKRDPGDALLIDVRTEDAFRKMHITGASNMPFARIEQIESLDGVPAKWKNRRLFFICEVGFLSAKATRKLISVGKEDAFNVKGGFQAWFERYGPAGKKFGMLTTEQRKIEAFPYKEMPAFHQWAAVIAAYVIKPIYMCLSFVLCLLLFSRNARRREELSTLKWAVVSFFVGESFCAVNYLVYGEGSYLTEYLHGYGMVLALGFTAYAVLDGADRKVFRVADPEKRCAFLSLCKSCVKNSDVACKAKTLAVMGSMGLIVVSCIPLLADYTIGSYNTTILGARYYYVHPVVYQLFELLVCPLYAVLLFSAALASVLFTREKTVPGIAKVLVSAGLGTVGFSVLRLLLFSAYEDHLVWSVFWEEATELLYILMVFWFLWLFYGSGDVLPGSIFKRFTPSGQPADTPADSP